MRRWTWVRSGRACGSSGCGGRTTGRSPIRSTWIPAELGDGIGEALADHGSLYEFLRSATAWRSTAPTRPTGSVARTQQASGLLDLEPGAPVFIVERVGFARARRVEWTRSVVRGEDYEVHVHLRR